MRGAALALVLRMRLGWMLILVTGCLIARPVHATVVGCAAHRSGDVVVNHCSNHGYYPRWMDRALPQTAQALELLRSHQVWRGEMQDRPLLVEIPWGGSGRSGVTIDRPAACERNLEDSDEGALSLGPCYRIQLASPDLDYPLVRGLAVEAAKLAPGAARELGESELVAVALRGTAARYLGIQLPIAFTPAPDRGRRLAQRWVDGRTRLWLTPGVGLPDLAAPLAHEPLWSRDGRFVVYASLDEMKIHDVDARTTHTVALTATSPKYELLLAYDTPGRRIVASFDQALFSDYQVWVVDAASGDAAQVDHGGGRPEMNAAQIDRWSQKFVASRYFGP